MVRQVEIKVFPDKVHDDTYIHSLIHQQMKSEVPRITRYRACKKINRCTRSKTDLYLRYDVYIDEKFQNPEEVIV
jgi:hypothetical protein